MVPNCRDKSELYREKMPLCIPSIVTNTHQRRPSHTTRRHRPRTALGFRSTVRSGSHSNGMRQRRPRTKIRHPSNSHDRGCRASQRNRSRKPRTAPSTSNRTYNEIDPVTALDDSDEDEEEEDQSVGAPTSHRVPPDQHDAQNRWTSRGQVFSNSENIEINPKVGFLLEHHHHHCD